jgi:tetratricopeptide (TPR) repeat protein
MVAQPSCVIEEVEDWHDAREADPSQQAQQDAAADSAASTTSDSHVADSTEPAAAVRHPQDDEDDAFVDSQETAEAPLSEEERQAKVKVAEQLKVAGNSLFGAGDYEAAAAEYSKGLEAAPAGDQIQAVLYANRAACWLKLENHTAAARDCTSALAIDGSYQKALVRRSTAYQTLDDLERALQDAQKVKELSPTDAWANQTVTRLTPIVNERREKMKDEMIGKLKDLGNTVLGKFGMSLDNFKAEKDPTTGSYSIKFNQ